MKLFDKTWNVSKEHAEFFTENELGERIKNQFKSLQFQLCLETGNSKEWDINILSTILLSKLFQEKDTKPHIERIRDIRNKLAHLPDMSVSDEMFDELYESLHQSMKSLSHCNDKFFETMKSKFINQTERSKINYEENKEHKALIDLAETKFSNKDYDEAAKAYSNAINFFEHTNEELGDLYHKRSLAYLYIYDGLTTKNDKYLYRSLSDAEKVIDYIPNFSTGYIQAAELTFKLNELERSENFYQNALAIECNNQELKNSLATVRAKIGQQCRREHLDLKYLALSTEEYNEVLLKQLKESHGVQYKHEDIDKVKSRYIKENPIKADVFLGHEYQYGSNKFKKNYELAAQYYGKAANKNDAEALYNLALLHIRGLGVKMDYQTGISLLKLAAEQPDTVILRNQKV